MVENNDTWAVVELQAAPEQGAEQPGLFAVGPHE